MGTVGVGKVTLASRSVVVEGTEEIGLEVKGLTLFDASPELAYFFFLIDILL